MFDCCTSGMTRYNCTVPVWSCEWNSENQHTLYAGQQNGQVLEFDTRNTGGPVRTLNESSETGSKSPVVAEVCGETYSIRCDKNGLEKRPQT